MSNWIFFNRKNKKMNLSVIRICFIDFFAYPLFNPKSKIVFGGAQIQLYLLTQELSKDKRFDISFLTDNRQNSRQDIFKKIKVYQFLRSPKTKGIKKELINFIFKIPFLGYIVFLIRLFIQIKKINSQVYIQRAASAETGLIALISKILRKKFIFMVAHEQDVNNDFVKKNGFKGKLFLLGLKLANKIICQTKEQQIQLNKDLKHKSLVIPSGYPIKKQSSFSKIKKQGILWVARAESWKNPELFINLSKKFPKEKFTMICPPAESNPNYFKVIRKKAQKVKNLTFIKQVPFNKINSYFKKAKVFISTSSTEGFPNTFIQAGKNMTPIISFKVNPDKIITKYQLGFCTKGKEDLLLTSLKKILTNQELWFKFSINAYQYVFNHHDLKKTVKSYKEIFLK